MSTTVQSLPAKKKSWFAIMMTSTLGRKLLVGLTGLFLILFLTVHLIGNLQLLVPYWSPTDNGRTFNEYAEFMGHNEIIQAVSIGNFLFIFLHIIYSIALSIFNRKARPVQYAYKKQKNSSSWASRNMLFLGTIVLIFLVVHLQNFWFQMKFGYVPKIKYSIEEIKNLYYITAVAFTQPWLVALYVLAMFGLAFHLNHGFQSAFQTLGLNHKKYTPVIQTVGVAYSIIVPALFVLIPLLMYLFPLS